MPTVTATDGSTPLIDRHRRDQPETIGLHSEHAGAEPAHAWSDHLELSVSSPLVVLSALEQDAGHLPP